MKKILFIIIAGLISLSVDATKYYIDPAGIDDAGRDGSISQPWQLLSYAAGRVQASTDTIFINAGTYPVDHSQVGLRVGVRILGTGTTSYLKTDYTSASTYVGWIHLYSASLTNGNQFIKNVKIGGESLAGSCAINIISRSDVEIDSVEIFDFSARGINIRHDGAPTTWVTDIKISNCNIHNCSDRTVTTSCGLIVNKGADGTDIHDNTLTQTGRAEGHNGNIYTTWGSYEKNTKFYRNVSTKPDHDGVQSGEAGWNFHLETGNCLGGFQVYENTFVGGVAIDIAGGNHYAGVLPYSYWIHHNTHSLASQLTYVPSVQRAIFVDLERICEDVIVERNYTYNVTDGVAVNLTEAGSYITRVKFRYNICVNLGYSPSVTSPWRGGFQIGTNNSTGYVSDIEIDNNVFIGNGAISGVGLYAETGSTVENIKIRNNIFQGIVSWGWLVFRDDDVNENGNFKDIYAWNNIMYDCVTNDTPYYENTPNITNYDPQDNIVSNPLFTGTGTPPLNYKLQSGSPAKDAGISVGLTKDYGGYNVPVGPLPDIGAWEYGADVDPPNWHPTGLGWDDIYFKNNFRDTVNFTVPPTIAGAPLDLAALLPSGLTATVNDLNATAGATGNFQGQINSLDASNDAKADTSLSNLSSVAINSNLLPNAAGTIDLGSATYPFDDLHLDTASQINFHNGDITATHSDGTLTFTGGLIVLPSTTEIGDVNATEISYVNEVTSAIQTQLNLKADTVGAIDIEEFLLFDASTDSLATLAEVRAQAGSSTGGTSNTVFVQLSDTIPLFVFGAGGGNDADSIYFTTSTIYGAFYNKGSDTLKITELRAVMSTGAKTKGTDYLGIQVYWNDTINKKLGNSYTKLNTDTLGIHSITTGTTDVAFAADKIPPGMWVWCESPRVELGRKPEYLSITLSGYKIPKYIDRFSNVRMLSDTIPLATFGGGGGNAADTISFTATTKYGAFFNAGNDTLNITELRAVMGTGAKQLGTDTLSIQVQWHATLGDAGATKLNTNPFGILSITTGETDTSFAEAKIPPNVWVWATTPSGAVLGRIPKFLLIQLSGYKTPNY